MVAATHSTRDGSPLLVEEIDDGVTLITLNRPDKRNALNVDLVTRLATALRRADAGRAVVLTGAGRAFCAGGDLDEIAGAARDGAAAVMDLVYGPFHGLVSTLDQMRVPVIGAVSGPCLGAGLDLALCCDLRIACAEATFASSWIRMGLVPGMGGARSLVTAVGPARAAELLLTGEPLAASTALDWGLLNAVVPAAELVDAAIGRARNLAAHPALALALTRSALRRAVNDGLGRELELLGATQGALLTHADFAAAVARFRTGGRTPTASGT